MTEMTDAMRDKLDAATFRRLLSHLDKNKQVQNIELMMVADFCRNCLGDWYREEAARNGIELTRDEARERVYGMPYAAWKEKHQKPATPEQMAAFEARQKKKAGKG
jgi:hypothetical protein